MASQQYSLRWNNYVRHMTSAFESLRSDRDLIDVTLSCEGKKIPAHKMLLSACSSYFKDLFKENPCQHPVIIFRNVSYDDLIALVDFMYNGEVNVEQEQLASFLNTAELLQVQGLTNSSKDQEKTKKTAKEDERVPAASQFEEDVDERSSTPTKSGPPAAKKRKWLSPTRTDSPITVSEPQPAPAESVEGEEEVQSIEQVPLKVETPDYDDDDDAQGSGADDEPDDQEIVQKIQKSDQLILTSSRNRTSNSDHSLFGNNSMDMDSAGDMSSFVMAGPSNESMGQEGMQDHSERSISDADKKLQTQRRRSMSFVSSEDTGVKVVSSEQFACRFCDRIFRRRSSCVAHIKLHTEGNRCFNGSTEFTSLYSLERHLRICSKKSKEPEATRTLAESRRLHPKKRCLVCYKMVSEHHIKTHLKLKHKIDETNLKQLRDRPVVLVERLPDDKFP